MIKQLSILALGLAITLPCAFATTVSLSLQETGVVGGISASSGTGFVSAPGGAYGDFVINNVSGTGSPIFTAPSLNLQTLNVSTMGLTGSHTLTIELTETGLSGLANPLSFANGFTGVLNGVTSETLSTYTDSSNAAFGMMNPVATTTFTTPIVANSYNQTVSAPTGSLFSETEVIVAVFGPTAGSDSLDSSILMTSAVPEPASLALLGSGLLGFALIRRRAAKKSA